MNKVFKVIWNHATQTWTAVSELGHAKGKTKSKKIVKLTALAGAVLGVVGTAQAAVDTSLSTITIKSDAPGNVAGTNQGDSNINIGTGANTYRLENGKVSNNAIAIGTNATGTGDKAVAIGKGASATNENGVAVGFGATNESIDSVAIGTRATSSKDMDVAIGKEAKATGGESLAFGSQSKASGQATIAVGKESNASGSSAVAAGYQSAAAGDNAVAVGNKASASQVNDIAVGLRASATGGRSIATGTAANASGAYSIATGFTAAAAGENSIAQGKGAIAGAENSIAIGKSATASGISIGNEALTGIADSIAIGHKSKVDGGAEGVAIGNEATNGEASFAAAVGATSEANANYSAALGYSAVADAEFSVALGAGSKAGDDFVESRSAEVNGVKYEGFAASTSGFGPGAVVSVGKAGSERQIKNVAAGQVTKVSTDAINGSQLYSVADALATKINKQHWNVGNNDGAVVSGVYHEDQVNFVNGNVTTVKVVKAPSKSSTPDGGPNVTNVSYDVNVGKGLKIENNKIVANFVAGNGVTFNEDGDKITINAQSTGGAASSVVSGNNDTLSVKPNATNPSEYIVTPITGSLSISKDEKGKVGDDAKGNEDNGKKLTTIQTTRDMINKAHWNLQIGTSSDPKNAGESEITSADQNAEPIHAGDTVNFFAGKNVKLKRQGSDITISAADTAVDKGEIIPATNTTNTNNNGTVMAKDGDGDKFANITNVVNAINSAFWKIGEENSGTVTPKGNVTAGSQVNFSNGVGTIAKVTADEANKTYKVQYDINAGPGIEIPATGDNKGKVTVKVDNSTVTINDDGQLVANSAWNANATGNVDGTSAAKAVKANATVNFDAGENLKVKQTGDAANQVYSFSLNQTLTNITSIQNKATGPKLTFGDSSINVTGGNLDMGNNKITNLKPGTDGTDAVNLDQLKASRTVVTSSDNSVKVTPSENGLTKTYDLSVDLSKLDLSKAKSSWNVKSSAADGGAVAANHNATEKNIADKNTVEFKAGKNLTVEQVNGDTGANVTFALNDNITLGKNGKDGKDGSIGVAGKDGAAVAINGKDGSIGLTGPKGADGKDGASVTIKPEKGTTTVAERDGGKDINRVTYTDKDKDGNDIKREIATLDDGLKFTGDDGETVNRTLGSNLNVKGGAADSTTAKNIRVTKAADGEGLDVNLANNVTLDSTGSLNIGGTKVKDGDIKIGDTHITNGAVTNLTHHIENPTTVVDSDVLNITDDKKKDAATVRDVLNSGWNLQANGEAVDAVTHGNTVNFASDGSVKITPTTDGNTSTINLSVNATNVVKQVTGNVSANTTTGKAVVGKDGVEDTDPNAGNKVATVGDVANTINNAGWITKATDGTNVTVNPGDRVEYVDGKGTKANVTVKTENGQDVVNVTYDVKTDGTTVTVNNDGNLTVVTGNITKASDDVTNPDAGKVTVNTGEDNKVATVKNVADAINSAGWIVNTGKAADQNAFKTETGTAAKVGAGDKVNFQAGKNLEVKRDGQNIIYATSEDLEVTTVKVGKDGKDGKDGSIGVTGKDGAAVAINGKDGSIGLTGPKGADGKDGASVTIKPEKGTTTVAERDGGKDINRVTYTDKDKDGNDIKREIATLDDGLKFTGDDGKTVNRTLGSNLNVKGGAADSTTAKNIRVTKAADGEGLDVNLANNIKLDNDGSLNIGGTTVKDGDIKIGDTHITNGAVTNLTHHIENPTTVVDSDVLNITDDKKKDAATVRDVLNSGWNLQANGKAVDAVTHGNNVNFASDKGTVTVTANSDGKTSVVNLDVNVDNDTISVNEKGQLVASGATNFNVATKDGGNKVAKKGGSSTTKITSGKTITYTAGKNIAIEQNGGDILVSTTEDLDQNSVTTNNLTVKEGGNVTVGPNSTVNMGGNQVHNVKAGTADTDAVNVSQLRSNVTHLNNRINKVGKEARGGIAGANAAAGLPQVYIPGKSMVAASAGTFKGESALAVGYSRSSDNGKVIFKLQGNANTQGDVGGSVGVGYQW